MSPRSGHLLRKSQPSLGDMPPTLSFTMSKPPPSAEGRRAPVATCGAGPAARPPHPRGIAGRPRAPASRPRVPALAWGHAAHPVAYGAGSTGLGRWSQGAGGHLRGGAGSKTLSSPGHRGTSPGPCRPHARPSPRLGTCRPPCRLRRRVAGRRAPVATCGVGPAARPSRPHGPQAHPRARVTCFASPSPRWEYEPADLCYPGRTSRPFSRGAPTACQRKGRRHGP